MTRIRLLAAAALAAVAGLSAPASAGPCVTVDQLPYRAVVVVCADHNGCLVYQASGSDVHDQFQPFCVPAVADPAGRCVELFQRYPALRGGACYLTADGQVACAGFIWTADTYCVPGRAL